MFHSMVRKLSKERDAPAYPKGKMTDAWDQSQVSSAVLMDIVRDLDYAEATTTAKVSKLCIDTKPPSAPFIPKAPYRLRSLYINTKPLPVAPPRTSPKDNFQAQLMSSAGSNRYSYPVPPRHSSKSALGERTGLPSPALSPLSSTLSTISEDSDDIAYDPYSPSFPPSPGFSQSYQMSPPKYNYYSSPQSPHSAAHREPLSPPSSLKSFDEPLTPPLRWESIIGPPTPPARYSLAPTKFNTLDSDMPMSPVSPRMDDENTKVFCIHFEQLQVQAKYSYQRLTSQSRSPKAYLFHSICYQLGIKYSAKEMKVYYLDERGEKMRIRNELDLKRSLDFFYLFVEVASK
jgi:hypothetical protein